MSDHVYISTGFLQLFILLDIKKLTMVTRLKVGIFLNHFVTVGCNKIPSDPEKSYEKAVTEGLIVGFTPNPPWVVEGKENVEGIESQITQFFC